MRVSGHFSRTNHHNNVTPTYEKKIRKQTHTDRKAEQQFHRLSAANQLRMEQGKLELGVNQLKVLIDAKIQREIFEIIAILKRLRKSFNIAIMCEMHSKAFLKN